MIDYHIAIPTYQRYEIVKDKTLAFLVKHKIPKDRITIFVANEEERQKYNEVIGDYNIVVGVKGLVHQRNFIEQEYYKEGDYVISLDDDIVDVTQKTGEQTMSSIESFYDIIEKAYGLLKENNAYHWGLYSVQNPFYMKYTTRTNLAFIIANLFGVIVQKKDSLKRVCETRMDYEYTIRQYIENKKIVRIDYLTAITKMIAKGGLEEYRKDNSVYEKDVDKLVNLFPQYATKWFRKNGMPEIKLRDKKKKQKPLVQKDPNKPWIKL